MKTLLRRLTLVLVLILVVAAALGTVFYSHPLWVADQILRFKLWRQGVHSHYIEAGGNRIHYFEAAPRDGRAGTPLVLVHGLGARGEEWAPLIPALAASGFHVYVPDLLGFGRSARPDVDYSVSTQEESVVDFMKAVGVTRADLGGWSMGGWVAAKLTVDHPKLVDRLVLYDSAGIYFPATFDASLFLPSDKAGVEDLFSMLQPMPPKLPDFAARAIVKRLQANGWVVRRSVDAMYSGRDLLDFRLASIARPTLIVWGTKDTLIPPQVAESMHHLIPQSSLTWIDGCGHLTPGQCWHSALATTVQFLSAQPALVSKEQTMPGN